MKCTDCGSTLKIQREIYQYDECGLKKVALIGIEVARCNRCGNYEISIPRIEALHQLIISSVLEPTTRPGEEVQLGIRNDHWDLLSV